MIAHRIWQTCTEMMSIMAPMSTDTVLSQQPVAVAHPRQIVRNTNSSKLSSIDFLMENIGWIFRWRNEKKILANNRTNEKINVCTVLTLAIYSVYVYRCNYNTN